MGRQWLHNVRLNQKKRAYRTSLISRISNPIALPPANLNKKHHRVGPFKIQQFNQWNIEGVEFTILERSHPWAYRKLLMRNNWVSIVQNNTGAAIATNNKLPISRAPKDQKSIAIAGCLLTGFQYAEQWLDYYLSCPEVNAVYWYVNASVAPKEFVEMVNKHEKVNLIPWDFQFFKRKNHYLNTFQPGHALPAAYADSKFRAIQGGHSHLLHIDLDEFIHPLSGLSEACIDKPVHFLNAYGSRLKLCNTGLDIDTCQFLEVEDSITNTSSGVGTSGNASVMSYGKTIAPLVLDNIAPDNHCVPVPIPEDLTISRSSVMIHFLDMEGTRTYNPDITRCALSTLDTADYTRRHWQLSAEFTTAYAVYEPLHIAR